MRINESNIQEHILPKDLKEATTLVIWRDYCIAQFNNCIEKSDAAGIRHWSLDHLMADNELSYLQFKKKKIDHERKMKIEKGHESTF